MAGPRWLQVPVNMWRLVRQEVLTNTCTNVASGPFQSLISLLSHPFNWVIEERKGAISLWSFLSRTYICPKNLLHISEWSCVTESLKVWRISRTWQSYQFAPISHKGRDSDHLYKRIRWVSPFQKINVAHNLCRIFRNNNVKADIKTFLFKRSSSFLILNKESKIFLTIRLKPRHHWKHNGQTSLETTICECFENSLFVITSWKFRLR